MRLLSITSNFALGWFLIAILAGCGTVENDRSAGHGLPGPPSNEPTPHYFTRPRGDELKVAVRRAGKFEIVATIENNSQSGVYLPFLQGVGSTRAAFSFLGLEKFDEETDQFVSAESSHFDPGFNLLEPGEVFTYSVLVPKPGKYRINIKYFVDPNFKERLDNNSLLFYSDPASWRKDMEKLNVEIDQAVHNSVSTNIEF